MIAEPKKQMRHKNRPATIATTTINIGTQMLVKTKSNVKGTTPFAVATSPFFTPLITMRYSSGMSKEK